MLYNSIVGGDEMNTDLAYEEMLPKRLAELRTNKGVSARDMSLSIGQGPAYINNIENGNSLPSMMGFFYICDYLKIPPKEFFDFENKAPTETDELITLIKKFDKETIGLLTDIAKKMKK